MEGGGSTLYFLDRVREVVTVEHNKVWFDVLQAKLTSDEKEKWNGNLIMPEANQDNIVLSASNPEHYFSSDTNYQNMTFKGYASYIDRFQDQYFDIVLVDGRARPSCIKHCVNKIKKNGLLIVDNADRNYYFEEVAGYLQDFKLIMGKLAPLPYGELFVKTNIWIRK